MSSLTLFQTGKSFLCSQQQQQQQLLYQRSKTTTSSSSSSFVGAVGLLRLEKVEGTAERPRLCAHLILGGGSSTSIRFPSSSSSNFNGFRYPMLATTNFRNLSLKTSVAVESNQLGSSDPATVKVEKKKYYFLVANAKFMLDEEEHFQEQMCERLRLFEERNMEQDFWLVIEPKFLDNFPNITKRLGRPAVALVSTNGPWITFMKLRLDRVLAESFEADSLEEALASTPTTIEFKKPENWVAPYPKYEPGWWKPFLLPESDNAKA